VKGINDFHVVFAVHFDINSLFFDQRIHFYFRISVQFTLHIVRPLPGHHQGYIDNFTSMFTGPFGIIIEPKGSVIIPNGTVCDLGRPATIRPNFNLDSTGPLFFLHYTWFHPNLIEFL
jgi:hypothetical protein